MSTATLGHEDVGKQQPSVAALVDEPQSFQRLLGAEFLRRLGGSHRHGRHDTAHCLPSSCFSRTASSMPSWTAVSKSRSW